MNDPRQEAETLSRRRLIAACGAAGGLFLLGLRWPASPAVAAEVGLALSEKEWRRRLSPARFAVLRQGRTERPGSSSLNSEKRRGTYVCAGCALPLFSSSTKFESGTGWPSFFSPIRDAVGTRADFELGYRRTEVHCRRCGGHLGHVFEDGPKPTGKRYCINGLALDFQPV